MAFQEIQSLDADNVVSIGGKNKKTGKDNPKQVEGYYIGSRQVESRKSKTGKSYIHFFQTEKGNLGVWGKTDLDRKISTVTPGTMVQISFSGMKETPNGDMYTFKVAQDKDNTIEVDHANFNDNAQGSYSDRDSDSYDSNNNDDEDSTQDEEETTSYATSSEAAKRKTHVQNLLNGKGKKI